jgi:signal transduction histidine kinase
MAAPTPDLVAELRRVPLLADLADDDLAWIAGEAEVRTLAPGDELFAQGSAAEWMYLGLDGTVETRRAGAPAGAPTYTFRAGDIYGVIPFSRMQGFEAAGVATTPARVARFPRARFDALLRRVPALEPRFVAFLADRVRTATRRDQQFEKLTALGRLSAGLAHELNNPAAAAQRSAAEARRRFAEAGRHAAALAAALADDADDGAACAAGLGAPDALRARAAALAGRVSDDPLDRADREEAVADWLAAAGAADAWALAPTFADAGLGRDDLDAALGGLPAAARAPAAAWCEASLAADAALATVERASGRISELVRAVKSYTHMDRARAAGPVDVREGVDVTLLLLAHKLRDRRVALERDFAGGLPPVRGFAGELNQVWTNLLDNAIDAAADGGDPGGDGDAAGARTGGRAGGRVRVRAFADGGDVVVEVEDDGPGVPDALRERVWEPFFTTKPVGRGTGLGLDIARHVVVEQHGGRLTFESRPGRTVFAVRLPSGAPAPAAAPPAAPSAHA